jgi:dTDP-3-amino-3,4,6-trideoxy-alpha-D-glucose transaminase
VVFAIPQNSPRANYLAHKEECDAAIARVLESGWYILGQEVEAFEKEFARYIGVSHAIGVASGTDALHLALRACGVGPGDLVFTVSHTAVATVAAIDLCGALPIFVDIDPVTFTMDPQCLEEAIGNASAGCPKVVIPVHLYGHPANLPEIIRIAEQHDLSVIEDCAQASGAGVEGKKVGAWGRVGAFSFYATKNLAAFGDGGMVVTNDPDLADTVRMLREYGWAERYISKIPGINSRLDELQAAVLRVKLRYLEAENEQRRKLAEEYNAQLVKTGLVLPKSSARVKHVYHQYVVRTQRRDSLRAYLHKQEIQTLIHYPVPVHLQPAYKGRSVDGISLPRTEVIANEILSLPIYAELDIEQLASVARQISKWAVTD